MTGFKAVYTRLLVGNLMVVQLAFCFTHGQLLEQCKHAFNLDVNGTKCKLTFELESNKIIVFTLK